MLQFVRTGEIWLIAFEKHYFILHETYEAHQSSYEIL